MFGLMGVARNSGHGASSTFSPVSLFANGEAGGYYDSSTLSSLWQDTGRTTPVTASGQTVAVIDDLSGNGNHITLTACTLGIDGAGRYYISANGTSSTGVTSSAVDFTGTDKITVIAGLQVGIAKAATVVKIGNVSTLAGSLDFGTFSNGIIMYRKASGSFGGRYTSTIGTTATVATAVVDLAGTTQATENPTLRINLAQGSLTNAGAADSGSGNFGNHVMTVFSGLGFFSGRLYSLIVRGATSTSDEIDSAETWTVSKCGPPLSFSLTPTTFTDTGATTNAGTHYVTSPFATVEIDTTATEIEVTFQNLLYANFPTLSEIGVYVNGAYYGRVGPGSGNPRKDRLTLPAGSKRLSIVNGPQAKPGGSVLGSWQTKIDANAAISQVSPSPTNRILVYGDSISVGSEALPATQKGWVMLLRTAYAPDSVALEGFGSRSLHDDCVDGTARAAFVAIVAAYAPERIWLAIGTNDYGLNRWSAASFGAAYAALLDDLNTALPSALIYCQTPLLRALETANGSGSTLPNYRAEIAAAVSTRTAYCTLVDGTAIMTTAELADGVHPTTAGHALYAAAVISELGI